MRLISATLACVLLSGCAGAQVQSSGGPPASSLGQVTTATSTPSPTSSTAPSPARILADSFSAMQMVSSVKVASVGRGARRLFNATTSKTQTFDVNNSALAEFQASGDHNADSYRSVSSNVGRTSQLVLVTIGRMSYSRTDDPAATPNTTPSVIPPGLWRPNLMNDLFVFPGATFGKFGQFGVQHDSDVVPAELQLDATQERGLLKLTGTGDLKDSGQDALRGRYTEALWVSSDTKLWSRWERTRSYQDGASYLESFEFRDYNVPNTVSRPTTNDVSRYELAAGGLPEKGDLVVRVCVSVRPAPYKPGACDNSRPLAGLRLKLVRWTAAQEPVAEATTDTAGVALFKDLPVYLDYQINLGCGPGGGTGVAVSAGSINGAGRTYLDFAVC